MILGREYRGWGMSAVEKLVPKFKLAVQLEPGDVNASIYLVSFVPGCGQQESQVCSFCKFTMRDLLWTSCP